MRTLKQVLADLEARANSAQALYDKGEAATAEDLEQVRTFSAEMADLEKEADQVREFEAQKAANEKRLAELNTAGTFNLDTSADDGGHTQSRQFAKPRQHTKNFSGPDAEEKAFRFGQWFNAAINGNKRSEQWCMEHGLREFATTSDINASGGILIPTEFAPDLIVLLEDYGSARRLCRVWPMGTDSKLVPRLTGTPTVYCPGLGVDATASDLTFDGVQLKVDTFVTLYIVPNETLADSAISLGDTAIGEFARAFAYNEDNMFINGIGTLAYFNRIGLEFQFKALSATIANIAGLVVAPTGSKTDWANITMTTMSKVKGKAPKYARQRGAMKWLCSETFYDEVMMRLAYAAGGNAVAQIEGEGNGRFMGADVEICQVMPLVPIASGTQGSISCYYGNFALGACFGDRQQYTVARSTDLKFASNQTAIRGTERCDINIHSVGNASATASLRKAGPIVGLIMDA